MMKEDTAESASRLIYCRYEGEQFPADQFSTDHEWGRIHEVVDGVRHSVMGEDIDETSHDYLLEKLGGA